MQSMFSHPGLDAYQSNHLHALGAALGDPKASSDTDLVDGHFQTGSMDPQLRRPPPSLSAPAGSRAGSQQASAKKAPAVSKGLFELSLVDKIKALQKPAGASGSGPVWCSGCQGSLEQPQVQSSVSQETFSTVCTGSSGSQGSARPGLSADRSGSAGGILKKQRSSKRLASKRTHYTHTQDLLQSSAAQRNPEADLKFKEILGQTFAAQLHRTPMPPGIFEGSPGQITTDQPKQPSTEETSLLSRLSSSLEPAVDDSQATAVMTLEQALDSMSPTQSFSLGVHNPFEQAANDDTWHFPPSRAEGSEGQGGRASPSSTATCHQEQLTFSLPQQACAPESMLC